MWHNKRIMRRKFTPGQKVLLYNLRLKFFLGNLRRRWSGPFIVVQVWPYETMEIQDGDKKFKVNGQKLKEYNDGALNTLKTIIMFKEPIGRF